VVLQRPAFIEASIAETPVWLCVDLEAGDPVASGLLRDHRLDDAVHRLLLEFVRPGARVLDVGCHLGTFALAAAARGAEVVAVEASPRRAELVRRAVERNGFERFHLVHGAVAEADGPVEFIDRGVHARLLAPSDPAAQGSVPVPAVSLADVLFELGWDGFDVAKLDVQGAEPVALRALGRVFESGARPILAVSGNARALVRAGSSIVRLRRALAELGYRVYLIDGLVETPPDALPTEPISQYLALPKPSPELVPVPPLSLEQTAVRVLTYAADDEPAHRRYFAEVMVDGPGWLREHGLVEPALRALALDADRSVRDVLAAGRGPTHAAELAASPPPPSGGLPPEAVVLADGVALRRASLEPERADLPGPDELLVDALSFHVRCGEHLAVLSEDAAAAPALLRAVAGLERLAAGRLDVGATPVLVSSIGVVLEPALSVGENALLFAGYLGADVGATAERVDDLATVARIRDVLSMPLAEVSSTAVLRMVLAVALECTTGGLLLLDVLPPIEDQSFCAWARARAAERRAEGLAILQAAGACDWPLGRPTRVLWLAGGGEIACGHAGSLLDAARRRRLGLERSRPRALEGVR
jgi:FkbM family methyltransferase